MASLCGLVLLQLICNVLAFPELRRIGSSPGIRNEIEKGLHQQNAQLDTKAALYGAPEEVDLTDIFLGGTYKTINKIEDDDTKDDRNKNYERDEDEEKEDYDDDDDNGSDDEKEKKEKVNKEDDNGETSSLMLPRTASLTPKLKCDMLIEAFMNLVSAVNNNLDERERDNIRAQMLLTTGMDIYDTAHIRSESCSVASISSLSDFASRAGISLDTMKQYYPSFVETINKVRSVLRRSLNTSYLRPEASRLVSATLHFYDTLVNIGLLNLS